MPDERYLITGGTGCIGAWVVRNLVRESVPVTVLASRRRFDRLQLLLTDAELGRMSVINGDINDLDALLEASRRVGINTIIHLAALQFPFCAAEFFDNLTPFFTLQLFKQHVCLPPDG